MKILKDAKGNPQLWKAEVSCTGKGIHNINKPCYSLLEINSADVFRAIYKDCSGVGEFYYYFTCPICGSHTELTGKLREEYLKSIQ